MSEQVAFVFYLSRPTTLCASTDFEGGVDTALHANVAADNVVLAQSKVVQGCVVRVPVADSGLAIIVCVDALLHFQPLLRIRRHCSLRGICNFIGIFIALALEDVATGEERKEVVKRKKMC